MFTLSAGTYHSSNIDIIVFKYIDNYLFAWVRLVVQGAV